MHVSPCLVVTAGSAALLAAMLLLYMWLLGSRRLGEAWRRGRLLLSVSVAGMFLLGLAAAPFSLDTAVLALPLVIVTQALVAQFFDRRRVGEALYGFNGRVYRVGIIDSRAPTAFAAVARGRVYASTGLYAVLAPDEATAVVAHEVGHGEALRPLPAAIALTLVAIAAAQAAEGVIYLAAGGCYIGAAVLAATAALAWVFYNWAWEHLADVFSVASVGAAAAAALARITGAAPSPPPGPLGVLAAAARSLRPRRSPTGAGLLVNPHPPPGLRLWLMARLAAGAATRDK